MYSAIVLWFQAKNRNHSQYSPLVVHSKTPNPTVVGVCFCCSNRTNNGGCHKFKCHWTGPCETTNSQKWCEQSLNEEVLAREKIPRFSLCLLREAFEKWFIGLMLHKILRKSQECASNTVELLCHRKQCCTVSVILCADCVFYKVRSANLVPLIIVWSATVCSGYPPNHVTYFWVQLPGLVTPEIPIVP